MQNMQSAAAEINALEAEAARAVQAGKEQDALRLWGRILALDPNHARTLSVIGLHAFRKGDMLSARVAFQRAVDTDGGKCQQWVNLALACQGQNDEAGEEQAIKCALTVDPSDLLGLILRANLLVGKRGRYPLIYVSLPLCPDYPEPYLQIFHIT